MQFSGSRSIGKITAVVLTVSLISVVSIATLVLVGPGRSTATSTSPILTTPSSVNVFGLMSTTGAGTHHTSVVFTSIHFKQSYTALVSDGRFSIQLPNGDAYNVTAKWAGNYSWQAGEIERGQLTVNISAGSQAAQSYNLVDVTPSSVVTVDGSLL